MKDNPELAVALRHLVAQHSVPAVLQALASVMADTGNVTGGMVSEIAAIEEWLACGMDRNTSLKKFTAG